MHELRIHKIDRTIPSVRIRRAHARLSAGLGLAILLALACGLTGRSQQSPNVGPGSMRPHYPPRQDMGSIDPGGDIDPITAEKRLRALNIERQKQMVSDANKLLKLARELNDEVAAAHAETFSEDQLQKIAEIEKLARSVKARMTTGVEQLPGLDPSALVPYSADH
jgi:hypothetical protein